MKSGKDYIGVGVGAIIINEHGKLLLIKRRGSIDKSRSTVGLWSAPGGEVEFGEKSEDAVIREVKEEIGVDIEIIKNIGFTDQILNNSGLHWHLIHFLCKIKDGNPSIMEPDNFEKIEWFDTKDIPDGVGIAHVIRPLLLLDLISEEEYKSRLKNTAES